MRWFFFSPSFRCDSPANVHHVFLQLLPLFRSDDFKEGIMAYMEKRAPKFQGK
jgi:hypothetical protein